MKLPNKFEFEVCGSKYIMAKHPSDGEYYCYEIYEDTPEPNASKWLADFIRRNIRNGDWVITKDLDEPIKAEPEMVFPFAYKHAHFPQSGTVYKGIAGGITVVFDDCSQDCSGWELEDVKRFVKEGTWIVTSVGSASVGEQKPACVHEYFWGDVSEAEGDYNPVVAPVKENPASTKLSIKIDTKAVEEAVKSLGIAATNTKAAIEEMQAAWRNLMGLGERVECATDSDYKIDYKFVGE